ncbi:MAG: molecular chaperone [Erythrobacteraceae bacterium]|nr:molecular chaperone [Erythrobacteraceae bacterium]
MRRFYKQVDVAAVEGGWQVTLDGRGVKTVKGLPQIVPTEALARALAAEWDAQGEKIDAQSLPLRDMTDYAIDIVAPDQASVVEKIVAYGDTDTLLYRADPDEPLYVRQQEVWEPIVSGFEQLHGISYVRVSGIIHREQHAATLDKLRELVAAQSPFAMASLEAMASLAASLLVGLNALDPDADGEALWQAASLEEEWQAEQWGREEEAEERRVKRQSDFLTSRSLALLARA